MLLYLIRHGQSETNAANRHGGWTQAPLTAQGRADALNAKRVLDGIDFDRVYSSDLCRAMETCSIAMPNAKPVLSPLLREIHVGALMGKTAPECEALYGEDYITNKNVRNYRPYGGESVEDQLIRLQGFLTLLENDPAPRVAAFCHEWSIQCVLHLASGQAEFEKRPLKNGGVCIFAYENRNWQLLDWGL